MNRAINFFRSNYYLATAVLLFLSFPISSLWFFRGFPFFAWVCLVPLLLYLRDKSPRQVYFISLFTGILGFLPAFEWIGNFGATVRGGYFVILFFLIPTMAIFFALRIWAAELLSRRFECLRFLIYPAVWIIIDWIQSIGFLAFPWFYLGYTQFPLTPLIQFTSITGVHGLTFIIVLFNYLMTDLLYHEVKSGAGLPGLIRSRQMLRFCMLVVFIAAASAWGHHLIKQHPLTGKSDMRVAMVQSCISPWESWYSNRFRYLDNLKKHTNEALKENPDFIIWSESATLETISYSYARGSLNSFEKDLLGYIRGIDRPLLTGEVGVIEDSSRIFPRRFPQNNAVLISRSGDVLKSYAKIHLVPFGEWFPYENLFPLVKDLTVRFGASDFIPGHGPVLFELYGRRFGVLVCYEGIFYRLSREYRNLGAEFLINITNDGWTDSYKGHMQHFAASVFRAVENGTWYLRAGNTGYTAVIDPYGRITGSMPILRKGYVTGDMDFSMNRSTFYSRYGDVFLYVMLIFTLILCILYIAGAAGERYGRKQA